MHCHFSVANLFPYCEKATKALNLTTKISVDFLEQTNVCVFHFCGDLCFLLFSDFSVGSKEVKELWAIYD